MERQKFVIALYDFKAPDDSQFVNCLSITKGDLFQVLKEDNSDWVEVIDIEGKSGYVPKTYIENFRSEDARQVQEQTRRQVTSVPVSKASRANLGTSRHGDPVQLRAPSAQNQPETTTEENSPTWLTYLLNRQGVEKVLQEEEALACNLKFQPREVYDPDYIDLESQVPVISANPENKPINADKPINIRAIRSCEEEGCLAVKEGEVFEVISCVDLRLEVFKKTGKRGFIPKQIAEELLENPDQHDWDVGDLNGLDAKVMLTDDGRDGTFVVRKSEQRGLILSYYFKKGKTVHDFEIFTDEAGKYYLSKSYKFRSLLELIECHQHNGAGLSSRLRNAPKCLKTRDKNTQLRIWEIDPSEIEIKDGVVGSGHYGEVYRATLRGKIDVAVKFIKECEEIDPEVAEEDFIAEARRLSKLDHPNIISFYGICSEVKPMHIVTAYMENGSLDLYLRNNAEDLFRRKKDLLCFCASVARGMTYLERNKIIHRDLAARNCLVGRNLEIQVSDFGLSRFATNDEYVSSRGKTIPYKWVSPEGLLNFTFSSKSDVWAFGIVMWEIYTCGEVPYLHMKPDVLKTFLQDGYRLERPKICSILPWRVMESCWKFDAEDRPPFSQIEDKLNTILEGNATVDYAEDFITETKESEQDWFVGELNGDVARRLLKIDGRNGTFVVRTSGIKGLILTYLYKREGQVENFGISKEGGKFFLMKDRKFNSLAELIFYHQHNGAGLSSRLKSAPASRQTDSRDSAIKQWEIKSEDLMMNEIIKKTSGQKLVRKGTLKQKIEVAVKMVTADQSVSDELIAEAKIMTRLDHPNLVQLYGICLDPKPLGIVMEYMHNGSLLEYLSYDSVTLSKKTTYLQSICSQVCDGMTYLERNNFIHRDLMTKNCYVGNNFEVKIGGFSFARFLLDDEYINSKGSVLAARWLAPEVRRQRRSSIKADVWAYGVLAWEVYTCGKQPYGDVPVHDLLSRVENSLRLSQPDNCPSNIWSIVESCFQLDDSNRPSFRSIKEKLDYLQRSK